MRVKQCIDGSEPCYDTPVLSLPVGRWDSIEASIVDVDASYQVFNGNAIFINCISFTCMHQCRHEEHVSDNDFHNFRMKRKGCPTVLD